MYKALREKLLTPLFLRNGVDYSIQLESLGQTVLPFEDQLWGRGEKAGWWPIFTTEQQMLEQGDIPFFTARASSDALIAGPGQQIEGCFQEPSFDLVLTRLKELGDEHLQQQVRLIRAALYAPLVHTGASLPAVNNVDMGAYLTSAASSTTQGLVAQALTIAEQIAMRAVHMADGSVNWIMPRFLSRSERYQLRLMGYDLFKGTCGVILFLAAVEKLTGGTGYRQLILEAVQSVGLALRDARRHMTEEMGIGGAIGLGSLVYALTRTSQFLDEPGLLDVARQAAEAITAEAIASDRALDVVAGAAGAILGLIALYDVSPEQGILDRGILCGQHLLQARTISEAGYKAWPTLNGKRSTGFSHGAAGIAYALLRLYAITQEADLLEAAREGFAYEDSLFSPEAGNWPDLPLQKPPFVATWCHGAPGIALARIGALSILDTAQIRQDIAIALQTTQQIGLQGPDHLCCGNLGRADILLTASCQLSRPDLSEDARRKAWWVVSRAEQRGSFALNALLPRWVDSLDFFQGMGGIGYALLRLAHPDLFPSVLLWQ
jgi:type 2 lantibiotic biosynthesis protein LanM